MNFEKMPQSEKQNFEVPETELKFTFSRSGGAGGQNVNKVETKVTATWNFEISPALSDKQKALIREGLKNRIESGELVVYAQTERTQGANRQKAMEILNDLVHAALNPPAERKDTKVPRREKKKRLEEKRYQSEKKQGRKNLFD